MGTTDNFTRSTTTTIDAEGRFPATVSNAPGYKETRKYLQQCVSECPAGAVVVDQRYDSLGRKSELKDSDLGLIEYAVDAAGRTRRQISPAQRTCPSGPRLSMTCSTG